MKSDAKRFSDISTLRELRKVQCENEAAKEAAVERIKTASLKMVSLSDVMLLILERYVPTNVKRFLRMIFGADK